MTATTPLDRRLNAYRPDLADAALEGQVEAAHFVQGAPARIALPVIGLRPRPDLASGIDTELLLGERVLVFERKGGWCWVKAESDGYVGYLPEEALGKDMPAPTHVVAMQRTMVYPEAELRLPHRCALSMGSLVRVIGEEERRGNRYHVLADGTAVYFGHLAERATPLCGDYVETAARFLGTPYLWGGRSGFGIDCSGLVQLSLQLNGTAAPRDTDMQAASLGRAIDADERRRGDLVFWKGHVAILDDAETMIHASGHTMTVVRESLAEAISRIERLYGGPTGYRRPIG